MAKGDDIQERLIDFSVRIIRLTAKLPQTPAGRHVAGQLLRSGTSPAPNYAEARGAESELIRTYLSAYTLTNNSMKFFLNLFAAGV